MGGEGGEFQWRGDGWSEEPEMAGSEAPGLEAEVGYGARGHEALGGATGGGWRVGEGQAGISGGSQWDRRTIFP